MGFTPRLEAPSYSNKWYIHTSYGGYNRCIIRNRKTGSVLPNCTGYAYGRFGECSGKTPKLSRANAELWYGYTSDGYKRGKVPKVGAVACWAKGRVGNSADGAGHVAIVEKVYSDGSFLISQSGYSGKRYWLTHVSKYGYLRGYKLQGFIYNPDVDESQYKLGDIYRTKVYALRVREKPGTNERILKRSELTKNAQDHAHPGKYARLKKNTPVSCQAVKYIGDEIWIRIPSGWVCARKGRSVYIS